METNKKLRVKKQSLILKNTSSVWDIYSCDKNRDKLGQGAYGSVYKVVHKSTQQTRALKVISKSVKQKNSRERLVNEIIIMEILDHPSILRLFETFEDEENIYMVLEICSGGDVFDKVLEKGQLDNEDALTVFIQFIRAVYYYQSYGIVHRDLKPENFLFFSKQDLTTLTVIDFGIAKKYVEGMQFLKSKSGTAYYVAPEVLDGQYDNKCDVWSSGVVLYVILCGYPPFFGENEKEILNEIRNGQLNFDGEEWEPYGEQTKDLIRNMICPAQKRFSVEQVMNHIIVQEFFQSRIQQSNNKIDSSKLFIWQSYPKLKKLSLLYLATQIDQNDSKKLKQLFLNINQSQLGVISLNELQNALTSPIEQEVLKELYDIIDCNCNGFIDYFEFIALLMDPTYYKNEGVILSVFNFLSDNKEGITLQSLSRILKQDYEERWSNIYRQIPQQRFTYLQKDFPLITQEEIHSLIQEVSQKQVNIQFKQQKKTIQIADFRHMMNMDV